MKCLFLGHLTQSGFELDLLSPLPVCLLGPVISGSSSALGNFFWALVFPAVEQKLPILCLRLSVSAHKTMEWHMENAWGGRVVWALCSFSP